MVKTARGRPARESSRPSHSIPSVPVPSYSRSKEPGLEEVTRRFIEQLVARGDCIGSRRWELTDEVVRLVRRYQ